MKFVTKLILLCGGLVTLTGLGIAYFAYTVTTTTLEAEVFHRMEYEAASLMANLDRMLFERLSDLRIVSTDPVLCAADLSLNTQPATDRLVTYRNTSKVYLSLSLFNLDGQRLVDSSGLGIGQRKAPEAFPMGFWSTTIQTGSGLAVGHSSTLGQKVVYFGGLVRCGVDRLPQSVVVGRIDLARMYEVFSQNHPLKDKGIRIDLATREGVLLYSNHDRTAVFKTQLSVPAPGRMTRSSWRESGDLVVHAMERGYLDFQGNGWFLKFAQHESVALSHARDLRNQIILFTFPSIVLAIIIAWFFATRFTRPINRLAVMTRAIAAGDRSARVDLQSRDELGALATDFNQMAESIEEQDWIKTQLARFSAIIQNAKTMETFSQDLVRAMTPLLDGGHGVLYLRDGEEKYYRLSATYGYKQRERLSQTFAPGEGLVGQCVLEKQPILQTDVPADYIQINSGLGESKPLTLLVVPFIFQEQVLAVMEIASFHRFTPIQQKLLAELSPILGLGLENQNRTRRIEAVLEETRAQAQEMTALAEALQAQQGVGGSRDEDCDACQGGDR